MTQYSSSFFCKTDEMEKNQTESNQKELVCTKGERRMRLLIAEDDG